MTKVDQAMLSKVHIGDLREKAILAIQDVGAWYHGTCNFEEGKQYEDIYVYGPKNKREAIVWDL